MPHRKREVCCVARTGIASETEEGRLLVAIAFEREVGLHEFDREHGGLDFARLDGLVAAYEVSPQCVIVKTREGREIQITARRDLVTGDYVSEYERRGTVSTKENTYQVWAQTPAYQACTAGDLEACLEAAVLEVNRVHVY
jgi:hypothetical protein